MRFFSGRTRIVTLLLLLCSWPGLAQPLSSLVDIQGVRGTS